MNTLNPVYRLPTAAAERLSAAPSPRDARPRRWLGAVVAGLLAVVVSMPAPAQGGNGGREGPSASPGAKASGESLTYDGFSGFRCNEPEFSTSAMAHLDIVGPVKIDGGTTLNGIPYDTYSEDLGTGPDTFPTKFDRIFGAPLGSANYTFVFRSSVIQGSRYVGLTITTIVCTGGALSATSAWHPAPEPIPAGDGATWAVLALLLAGVGLARLARRRA